MSLSGIDAFDRSLHETNVWLKDLKSRLGTEDSHVAYGVLRAGLHALRDRIGPENAVHLGAQLPMLLRGLYYEGWRLAATPTRERHRAQFLEHVGRELRGQGAIDPETAIRAVFEVLWDRIDAGEVAKVIDLFPAELRELWPRLARGD
jgi:uncharacterized protein (DUF2267 family)